MQGDGWHTYMAYIMRKVGQEGPGRRVGNGGSKWDKLSLTQKLMWHFFHLVQEKAGAEKAGISEEAGE